MRSQKKVKNVQLLFAKLQLGHSDLVLKNWLKNILNSHISDCENFFPLQDMGPAEKQHLPDLLNFCQTYSLHAIGLPISQIVALLNSVSSRIILHNN